MLSSSYDFRENHKNKTYATFEFFSCDNIDRLPSVRKINAFKESSSRLHIYLAGRPWHPSDCKGNVIRSNWFRPGKTSSSKTPLRQLSKVCACFADAWICKAVFAPNWFFPDVDPRRHDDFQKSRGERAQRSKKFNPEQTKSKLHIVKLHVVFISILITYKIDFNSFKNV